MPNAAVKDKLTLTEEERAELASMARSRSLPAALALRARIVLACEGGAAALGVARALGINRGTVTRWRDRYAQHRRCIFRSHLSTQSGGGARGEESCYVRVRSAHASDHSDDLSACSGALRRIRAVLAKV